LTGERFGDRNFHSPDNKADKAENFKELPSRFILFQATTPFEHFR
jgi:hypothetical protein